MSRCLRHRFASRVLPPTGRRGRLSSWSRCASSCSSGCWAVLDVGNIHVVQRKLQIAADAAGSPARRNSRTARCRRIPRRSPTTEQRETRNALSGYTVTTSVLFGCLSSTTVGGTISCTPNSAWARPRSRPSACRRIHRVAPRTRSAWSRRPPCTNLHGGSPFRRHDALRDGDRERDRRNPDTADIEMIDDNTASIAGQRELRSHRCLRRWRADA